MATPFSELIRELIRESSSRRHKRCSHSLQWSSRNLQRLLLLLVSRVEILNLGNLLHTMITQHVTVYRIIKGIGNKRSDHIPGIYLEYVLRQCLIDICELGKEASFGTKNLLSFGSLLMRRSLFGNRFLINCFREKIFFSKKQVYRCQQVNW